MSANAMPAHIERGGGAGCDSVLTKALDLSQLLAVVAKALGRSPGCSVMLLASGATRTPRQPSPGSTSIESLSGWPDSPMPAAPEATGVPAAAQQASRRRGSATRRLAGMKVPR